MQEFIKWVLQQFSIAFPNGVFMQAVTGLGSMYSSRVCYVDQVVSIYCSGSELFSQVILIASVSATYIK